MQAAEDDRRDKKSPKQIQPVRDGLEMITPKKEFFVEANDNKDNEKYKNL